MLRQQCDGVEHAKREQSGSAPTSERRQTRPRLRGDSRLASPLRQGQKHTRRKRVRRCSRSRKRTVTFAAAGLTFCQKRKRSVTENIALPVTGNAIFFRDGVREAKRHEKYCVTHVLLNGLDRRCFTQENATTEKFHADVSQNR